jgi:SpoVK/Ycf46/Vps4 family AAA+-type ATPase
MTGQSRPPFIQSLLDAIARAPEDLPLRLHTARALLDAGDSDEALEQCSQALKLSPANSDAVALLEAIARERTGNVDETPMAPNVPLLDDQFDWDRAESQMNTVRADGDESLSVEPHDGERPAVRLDDVGGLKMVKQELEESFLLPMANPTLRAAYGGSLGRGLLLYGPPGCGKTFLGKALAGELGASFFAFSLADVLDSFLGQSERNVRSIFEVARAHRPAVIFFDEVDAIGQKRANLRGNPAMRGTVNQLLSEMDGAQAQNEGVFVLGASNQPWDVDPALRRPGRFDRTLFVPPPDPEARSAIFRFHTSGRPLGSIDFDKLTKLTEGFSGADIARLCEVATRKALTDAARSGQIRPIEMSDFDEAVRQVTPTTAEWLSTARNVVQFANQDGIYDELATYLKTKKR